MLERIARISKGTDKNGYKLTSVQCPWLKENKPYGEAFDVLTTKSYDISLNSSKNVYDLIDQLVYGYGKGTDIKKIINANFETLLIHLNDKK